MPFKSTKQKTYLAINEPEVYKKFKKEEQNMDDAIANYKKAKKEKEKNQEKKMQYMTKSKKPIEPEIKYLPGIGSKGGNVHKKALRRKMFKSKKSMGGKVYKVDNSGQQLVAKQYGGKIHG